MAEMLRLSRRSSEQSAAKVWQQAKIRKFEHHFLNHEVIDRCKAWQPACESVVAKRSICPTACESSVVIIRIVLPFRREWAGISKQLKAVLDDYRAFLLFEIEIGIAIQVSWSSGGCNLQSMLGAIREGRSGGGR